MSEENKKAYEVEMQTGFTVAAESKEEAKKLAHQKFIRQFLMDVTSYDFDVNVKEAYCAPENEDPDLPPYNGTEPLQYYLDRTPAYINMKERLEKAMKLLEKE